MKKLELCYYCPNDSLFFIGYNQGKWTNDQIELVQIIVDRYFAIVDNEDYLQLVNDPEPKYSRPPLYDRLAMFEDLRRAGFILRGI